MAVRSRRLSATAVPAAVMAAIAIAVVVGNVLTTALEPRVFGSWLGAPLPPLFLFWDPMFSAAAAGTAVVLLAAALAAPWVCSRRLAPLPFAAAALAGGLGLRLLLSATRGGVDAWSAPFRGPRGSTEYLPALPGIEGLGLVSYLDRFAEIQSTLPAHPSAHPPGTIVALYLLGIDSPGGMAALTILAGAVAIPLTYLLGRTLLEESHARTATLLLVFSPAAMIYGVASADALFATLGLLAAVPLVARGRSARVAGAVALAIASLFSWALLAVGAFAVAVAFLREGPRAALRLALLCGGALFATLALLHALTGFDPIGSLATTSDIYRLGISDLRPLWYWALGSPAAFLIAIGIPLSWFLARALAAGHPPAVALAAIVVTAAVLGFSKAETERIWLFMAPLACVAAAPCLQGRSLRVVLALLAAQALVTELLFDTLW